MSEESIWNEETRMELRSCLQSAILGELRLAKRDPEEILEFCQVVHIDENCPEAESEDFSRFASEEISRIARELEAERASWPEQTDCDRLDRVEETLRGHGILLWQASPCCDTCTSSELPDRINEIEERHPGFAEHLRGYGFFIDQNLPEMLADSYELSIYLAYGWFSPDGNDVEPEFYTQHALSIAREICECLRDEGFEVDWNGSFDRKIGVTLNWQRRAFLA